MNITNFMPKRVVNHLSQRCLNRQIAKYGELIAENDRGVRIFRRSYEYEVGSGEIDITRTVKMKNSLCGKLVRTVIKEWPLSSYGWSLTEKYRVTNDVTKETKRVNIIRSPLKDFRNKIAEDDGKLDLSGLLWVIVPKRK